MEEKEGGEKNINDIKKQFLTTIIDTFSSCNCNTIMEKESGLSILEIKNKGKIVFKINRKGLLEIKLKVEDFTINIQGNIREKMISSLLTEELSMIEFSCLEKLNKVNQLLHKKEPDFFTKLSYLY